MFKITIVACGNKMPAWVNEAANEFLKRLQDNLLFNIVEIPLIKRTKSSNLSQIIEKEAALMKAAIPAGSHLVALEIQGKTFSSEQFATKFAALQQITSHLCILIGGPEGLNKNQLNLCQEKWSLSSLTLPHPIVRIVLLEAIYRSWAILNNHPYHK